MKNRSPFFRLSLIGVAAATPLVAGCDVVHSWQTKRAYREYQAAAATGDPIRTKIALLRLVSVDEDVLDYWMELGRINLQTGDYRAAFDAFSHAHELDRTNVTVLAALTKLALANGQVDFAQEQARTLALVAPDHPLVELTRSYVALRAGNLQTAEAGAKRLVSEEPDDPDTNILRARIMIAREQLDAAIALLEQQHRATPQVRPVLQVLAPLYRARELWGKLALTEYELYKRDPGNEQVAADLVEALLRAGNIKAAGTASGLLMAPSANLNLVVSTLATWSRFAPKAVMPGALELAKSAEGERRAAFASYFNRVGKPGITMALLERPRSITPGNSRWNAAFAQALALQGQVGEAQKLFDKILGVEPDQVEALRGRAALGIRSKMTKQAVEDAQRLVTVSPSTGDDRLLLAQTYLAAGSDKDVLRVLWQAFQELPDDERIVAVLKQKLVSSGDLDAARRLSEEYAGRKMAQLTKALV